MTPRTVIQSGSLKIQELKQSVSDSFRVFLLNGLFHCCKLFLKVQYISLNTDIKEVPENVKLK